MDHCTTSRRCSLGLLLLLTIGLSGPAQSGDTLSLLVCNDVNVSLVDCIDLVNLYNSTEGDSWANNSGWGTPDVDSWFGITMSPATGTIVAIDLALNRLSGTLPTAFDGLRELTFLQLSSNLIKGSLPEALGNLRSLELLQAGANQLSGPLPESLGTLTRLDNIELGLNQFTGEIPASYSNLVNLQRFGIRNGGGPGLTGPLPDVSRMTQLRVLDLSEQNLEGSLDSLRGLQMLEEIMLGGNALSGSLPASFFDLPNLRTLELRRNALSGALSISATPVAPLQELDLGLNDFSGPLTKNIGQLEQLTELRLDAALDVVDGFTGAIPAEIGNLQQLEELDLSGNQFRGEIPGCLGNLSALNLLSLQLNDLTGPVPDALTRLNLQNLFLGGNFLDSNAAGELTLNATVQTWFDNIPNTEFNNFVVIIPSTVQFPPPDSFPLFENGFEPALTCP